MMVGEQKSGDGSIEPWQRANQRRRRAELRTGGTGDELDSRDATFNADKFVESQLNREIMNVLTQCVNSKFLRSGREWPSPSSRSWSRIHSKADIARSIIDEEVSAMKGPRHVVTDAARRSPHREEPQTGHSSKGQA